MPHPRHVALVVLAGLALPPAALAQAPGPTVSLTVVNRGQAPVRELFVTPAGNGTWGRSVLAGKTLAPGQGFTLRRPSGGNCIFDLRTVDTAGKTQDQRGINACKTVEVSVGAGDASFRLVNRGKSDIVQVFATPSGQETFGRNRLDGATVPPGAEHLFHIVEDGNCTYDLKVVFADKTFREKKHADLCKVTDLPVQ